MIDRRVQRTLRALHEALIALILEKEYESITVGDILKRANVGRSTVYSHYSNKDELLQAGIDALGKELTAIQKREGTDRQSAALPFAFSRALFVHAESYRSVYRAMVGKHAGVLIANRLRILLRKLVARELACTELAPSVAGIPQAAVVEYLSGSLLAVLMWWVDDQSNRSAEEVDLIFRRLALSFQFAT